MGGKLVRRLVVGLLTVAGLIGAGFALALWMSNGSGGAASEAIILPKGNTPSFPTKTSTSVTVSWTEVQVSGSNLSTLTGGAYLVKRNGGTASAGCGGTTGVAASSCTDTGLTPNTAYMYTITPKLSSWQGAESSSASVTTDQNPDITISFPAAGGRYNNTTFNAGCTSAGFCGTATDHSGSGISSVQVSIKNSGNLYWNGTGFSSVSETLFTATTADGFSHWSYGFDVTKFSEDSYTVRAVVTDAHTNTNSASTTFTIDRTAPSVTITKVNGSAVVFPYSTIANVTSLGGACGTAPGDSTTVNVSISGTASQAGTATCSVGTWSYTTSPNLTLEGTYTVSATQSDAAGNTGSSGSQTIIIDRTAPTQSLSLTGASNAFLSSGTLYYKGNTSGSFQLVDAVTDSGSGPASSTFPAIGTTGWTHNAETVTSGSGSPPTISYTSSTYSWTSSPSNPANQTITATDALGHSGTTSLAFASDTTAPSGGSVTYTNGYVNLSTAPPSISFTQGTDGGSGVDTSSGILQRASTTLSAGTCGASYSSFTTIATNPSSPYTDTGATSASCYKYQYLVSDRVGNQATYTSTNVLKLDAVSPTQDISLNTSAPSGIAHVTGSGDTWTAYYNGNTNNGSITLADTASDTGGSGLTGNDDWAAFNPGGGWTADGSHTCAAASLCKSSAFKWTGTNPTSGVTETVTTQDAAGNMDTATITFVDDSTTPDAPTMTTLPNAIKDGQTLSVTSASDNPGGSAVASVTYYHCAGTSCTPSTSIGTSSTGPSYSFTWNGQPADGTYTVAAKTTDNVGNVSALSPAQQVIVENTPKATAITISNHTGGIAGKPEEGDTIAITYSGPLAVNTLCAAWSGDTSAHSVTDASVTLANHSSALGNHDGITSSGVTSATCGTLRFGSLDLGSDNYITADVTFTSSTFAWDASTNKLTITLGSPSNTGALGTEMANHAPKYTADGNINGSSGAGISTTAFTGANQQQF